MASESGGTDELKQRYFEAMSFAPATVNVVTTDGAEGRAGVTVSAMSSVSADGDHPVLLVCVNEAGAAAERILGNEVFCVNILREHQSYVSDVFAGRYKDSISDKFDETEWSATRLGSPAIEDALAAIDCRISHVRKVGSHYVIFGDVHDIILSGEGRALTYARRGYNRVQPIEISPAHSGVPAEGEAHLTVGCFHTFAPYLIPPIIRQLSDAGDSFRLNLIEGDAPRLELGLLNGEIDLAFIYGTDFARGLVSQPVASLAPQVLLPANHRLAEKELIHPRDLSDEPMISAVDTRAAERVEQALVSYGATPNVVYRSSSLEMARSMVAQGLGFAIVMANIVVRGDGERVVTRALEVDAPPGRIALVQAETRAPHPLDQRMLDLARAAWG